MAGAVGRTHSSARDPLVALLKKEPKPPAAASNSDMHIRMAILILSVGIAQAQSGVPTFRVDGVRPSGGDRPVQLLPGMLVSIYGTDLGPREGCTGQADTKKRETPSPLRPNQSPVETLIYPKELCGVQVFFGATPSGLLYVQAGQINFKVPQEASIDGTAPLPWCTRAAAAPPWRCASASKWPRSRWNSRRTSADRSGFTSRRRPTPGTAMCNIPWKLPRPISAVTRWRYGAMARCSPEFRCRRRRASTWGWGAGT